MQGDIKERTPPIVSAVSTKEEFDRTCEPSMIDRLLIEAQQAMRDGQIRYAMAVLERLQVLQ